MREWAVKLEAKPKYVVSSTRKDFPWTNSHLITGDLRLGVQEVVGSLLAAQRVGVIVVDASALLEFLLQTELGARVEARLREAA